MTSTRVCGACQREIPEDLYHPAKCPHCGKTTAAKDPKEQRPDNPIRPEDAKL